MSNVSVFQHNELKECPSDRNLTNLYKSNKYELL